MEKELANLVCLFVSVMLGTVMDLPVVNDITCYLGTFVGNVAINGT